MNEEAAGIKRADLFNLIEELVMWENSNNSDVIRTARAEIARCVASRLIETGKLKKDSIVGDKTTVWDLVTKGHCKPNPMGLDSKAGRVRFSFDIGRLPPADVVNAFLAEHAPPVLDPFAGGGSIPLEAQRLGLRANASDLNPVPVLINKALIEIPPKFVGRPPVNPVARDEAAPQERKGKRGKALVEKEWPGATGLVEDVRYYGQWMRDEAEKQIGHLYPKVEVTAEMAKDRPELLPYVEQKLTVIAWLWARTVECPNPACRVRVPLMKSFALCSKSSRPLRLVPKLIATKKEFQFLVEKGSSRTGEGTVSRKGAQCLACGTPIPFAQIRTAGREHQLGEQLLAIICNGRGGRVYFPASAEHAETAQGMSPTWKPDVEIPHNPFSLRPPLYGLTRFSDLFTERQLTGLSTFADVLDGLPNIMGNRASKEYIDAVRTLLALSVSRVVNRCSSACFWDPVGEKVQQVFGRQAIAMAWDFVEGNPLSSSSGNFYGQVEYLTKVIEDLPVAAPGRAIQHDAATSFGHIGSSFLISTDPPYYDNIDYADLSDFFYIWLRRLLGSVYPDLLKTVLTPKTPELVATPYRHEGDRQKAKEFFEKGLGAAIRQMRGTHIPDAPLTIFYAFKQSETDGDSDEEVLEDSVTASTGWETMLEGVVQSGFSISGTWPMRTELVGNLKKQMSALASSVVLVCRPRPENAALATRKEFITALRRELPDALRNLQRGNIAPVDLAQAAIGPGMATFTRYSKVVESDGSSMTVRTALGLINQTLDEVLAEQEGEFDGDTRWALSWFEQFGIDEGPFGDAETLSKAKNTAINGLQEAGVIIAKAGKVRLVKRDELPDDWNPATDKRLTVWEVMQHLIRRLDQQGETGAAELVGQLGGIAEVARDLAYRLYSTCERKKWAQDALAYNSLVVAWPELTKLASAQRHRSNKAKDRQQEMF